MIDAIVHVSAQEVASCSKGDALVIFYHNAAHLNSSNAAYLNSIKSSALSYIQVDQSASSSVCLVHHDQVPGKRLILAPLNQLFGDIDDSRNFADVARSAIRRALSSGSRSPIVAFPDPQDILAQAKAPHFAQLWESRYSKFVEVSLLGIMQEVYEPLQAREHGTVEPISTLNIVLPDAFSTESSQKVIKTVLAMEQGRYLARDVGGSDPERMTPLKCAEYIVDSFKQQSHVKVTVVSDVPTLHKEYPLLHAVARASLAVPRHAPCVVRLEYHSPDPSQVKETLFLVGKGVTYDTGGADLKVGGAMRFMSRDKCGASGVAGFMKTLSLLQPKHVNVVALLGFVRNSIGPDSYVSDEIITARSGCRVLIGNTDAEGRMVMCDLLCQLKEEALKAASPARLFTVATLTGHAIRACGHYSVVLDNGPAQMQHIAQRIQKAGDLWGECVEVTSLRKDDYHMVRPGSKAEDVIQANDKPSTMTSRGHQFPMAFLSIASGLTKYGLDNVEKQLAYTHLDIAGSAEEASSVGLGLSKVTGAPVVALTAAFLY